MCGFVVGFNGYDNEDGEDEWIKRYRKENKVGEDDEPNEHLVSLYGEYGPLPYSLWATPGWVNDGNGQHYRETDPKAKKVKHQWPAYNSVAIFFDAKPTEAEIKTLQERARKFVELRAQSDCQWEKTPIVIEGFRLIVRRTTEEEIMNSHA
jgi:hypothetical protein